MAGSHTANRMVRVSPSNSRLTVLAWIQNATLRENIVFGQSWNEHRYWQAVKDASLIADLEILPDGDLTEVCNQERLGELAYLCRLEKRVSIFPVVRSLSCRKTSDAHSSRAKTTGEHCSCTLLRCGCGCECLRVLRLGLMTPSSLMTH